MIPLLERSFYVVCVSYDGFDETEDTVFPSMIEETEKIEGYIQKRLDGKICCAYGCSLGGSFVGLLVQRRKVYIDHGILGSSDLDQSGSLSASFKAHLMAPLLQGMLHRGKLPNWMNRWVEKRPSYEARYRAHFAEPDIIHHDLQHEELLVCHPQKWVSEVENCCGILTSE